METQSTKVPLTTYKKSTITSKDKLMNKKESTMRSFWLTSIISWGSNLCSNLSSRIIKIRRNVRILSLQSTSTTSSISEIEKNCFWTLEKICYYFLGWIQKSNRKASSKSISTFMVCQAPDSNSKTILSKSCVDTRTTKRFSKISGNFKRMGNLRKEILFISQLSISYPRMTRNRSLWNSHPNGSL